jgi:hypothetical protein
VDAQYCNALANPQSRPSLQYDFETTPLPDIHHETFH